MSDSAPSSIEASFTHHGMEARFRARAPREARILAVALAVGILMPLVPVGALIAVGTWWPEHVGEAFGPVFLGIVLTLLAQCTAGPLLFNWAGKPAEIVLHIGESSLEWQRDGERTSFDLARITDIEAMSGEIRVEDREKTLRMPCAGLKKNAVEWLEARMKEAWKRKRAQMQDSDEDRAQRRKIGQLVGKE
ncbi:MAG: hypothetical protein R3F61_15085 [Myxococcota bacterium]